MLVQLLNNTPVTTSLQVAEQFKKDHSKILRDIRQLLDIDTEANFGLSDYQDKSGKSNPMYYIDKDGFTLLAMGFTGKKAFEFKKNYIRAFNEMEKELKSPKQLSTLDMLKLAVSELEEKQKENQRLALENTTLATRELEVKTQKEYKWKSQEVQNDRGRTINYYVRQHFYSGSYPEAHRQAKQAYRDSTGVNLPDRAYLMSMEQKKEYLLWLSKI